MANIKNVIKKLVNAGYSKNRLLMMTEKEIRDTYKIAKEETTMIKVVCKNKVDSKGNTSTSIKEYESLEVAMKAAKDVAEAASVISVTVVGKDEIIVKEESIMKNDNNITTKIKRDYDDSFETWINKINNLLSSNGIHLDNDKLLTIIDEETDSVSISVDSKTIDVHGWCAGEPVDCCYDFHGNLKEYSDEGTNFEYVSVGEVEKEEITMEALVKRITENKKIHDNDYIDRATLKTIMNEQFGFHFNNRSTRTEMVEALMAMYKDSLRVGDEIAYGNIVEDNNVKDETTMTSVAEVVSVGDLSITSDRVYHDDTIIEKAVPVAKVNNPTPDDAKVLTYRLMHKIGDHAINNRKKGFGTTVSAWMLCAYILEVKYGMTHLKGHEHEVTDEMKETVKNVRKWLLDNGYIKTVTFKDEKGFVFYTPEYDGNRKDKMYDATKFQSTGKIETTTYRVTKEMNKWYTK